MLKTFPDDPTEKYCCEEVRELSVVIPVEAAKAQYGVEPAPAEVRTLPALPAVIFPNVVDEEA